MKFRMHVVLTNPDLLFQDNHDWDYAFSLYSKPQTVSDWVNIGWVEFEFDATENIRKMAAKIAHEIQTAEADIDSFREARQKRVGKLMEALEKMFAQYPDALADIMNEVDKAKTGVGDG